MPTPGETAPDFELLDDSGTPVRLSALRGKKIVLYFYPKDFTSGCELQACAFRDHYAEIETKNAIVLGVSADGVDSHREFRAALNLPFRLLVDADFAQAKTWGAYGTKTYPDGVFTGVIRSQFVIDEEGTIIDAQAPVSATDSLRLALEKLG
jgi:peroxiredoxin Q/BCP